MAQPTTQRQTHSYYWGRCRSKLIEHIMTVFDIDRIRSGLWKSDVFMKDRQNVNAAIRILQKEVRVCIKEWSDKETLATRAYLKMGHYLLRVYAERELTVQQRAKLPWAPLTFLRYWNKKF